jgi:hypothetical protein
VLVVLDACVLYPPSLRDLLLTLAALDAFDIRWSKTILEELRRNVVADNPQVVAARFSDHTLAEMRRHFPEAMVTVSQAEIDRLDNPCNRQFVGSTPTTGSKAWTKAL